MNLDAELYALTHRGNPGDVAFYRRVCRGAASVLELGSGYGRLLCALARAKRQLIGLELSTEFTRLARRNLRQLKSEQRAEVRLLQGDMRDFTLTAPVERVLLPYNALYCLLTKRDALACFRAARRALVAGGLLALDVWNAGPFQRSLPARSSNDDPEPILTLRHAGRSWDVFERTRVRPAQRLDVSYYYLPQNGAVAREIPIAQRYYLVEEIQALLERAGFELTSRYGDFSGGRFTKSSAQLVVLARAT